MSQLLKPKKLERKQNQYGIHKMIHAFILIVLIGSGDDAKQQPSPMYLRSIDVCQYYAKRIPRQYGNYGNKHLVPAEHRITAYCKPVKVNPEITQVYDY
jgi:hypothetical protein